MAKRGRKPKLSIARAKQALEKSGSIRTIAAKMLAVHRSTLCSFMNKHPSLQAFADDIEEVLKDDAEDQVIKAIRAGDMPTVRWYMELKGKDRGYVRRVESTGSGGGPVEVQQKHDLSGYSDEELEQMLAIAEAREKREALRKSEAHREGKAALTREQMPGQRGS